MQLCRIQDVGKVKMVEAVEPGWNVTAKNYAAYVTSCPAEANAAGAHVAVQDHAARHSWQGRRQVRSGTRACCSNA